jgi:hypothetical protein
MQEADQANATFPEHIYELASEHRVGEPVKRYRPAMFWWLIVICLCIVACAWSLSTDIQMYTRDNTNAQQLAQLDAKCQTCSQAVKNLDSQMSASNLSYDSNQIWNDTAAVVAGLLLLAFLLYFRQHFCLYRCSDGLLLSFGWLSFFRKKGSPVALPWDEIAEVYWKGNLIRALRFTESELAWFLTRFRKTQDISECVESEVTPRLFAQALEQYKRTGSVYFDALSISYDGLTVTSPSISWGNSERIVPWQDLEDIRFADSMLSVKLQGEWKGWIGSPRAQKRLTRTIPNPTVYVTLAKYLLENARIEEKRTSE